MHLQGLVNDMDCPVLEAQHSSVTYPQTLDKAIARNEM